MVGRNAMKLMKLGDATRDGDFGWPYGVDTYTDAHLLKAGTLSDAVNIRRDYRSASLRPRPAFVRRDILWASGEGLSAWNRAGAYQGSAFAHQGENFYALKGGRLFAFMWDGGRFTGHVIGGGEMMHPTRQAWVTGVPGGVIVNDGYNTPLVCNGLSVSRPKPYLSSISAGRSGMYVQGRFFYVSMDGRSILASDIDNPASMQEAIDSNVYGWEAPDSSDPVIALGRQRVLSNTVEMGNLVFSTTRDIYTIDVRGPRNEWSVGRLGRVEVALPGVSACGPYAMASLNSNLVFRARQPGLNLCMLNQLATQFARADSLSGQFVEASQWLTGDTAENTIVVTQGSWLFTTNGLAVSESGTPYFRYLLAFEAGKDGSEGLVFHGAWVGPRVVDVKTSETQVCVVGEDNEGHLHLWSISDTCPVDIDSLGHIRPIRSLAVSRGYAHKSYFSAKEHTTHSLFFQGAKDVSAEVGHRLDTVGGWSDTRIVSLKGHTDATVGPVNLGETRTQSPIPGAGVNVFHVEQLAISWTGGTLAGVRSDAKLVDDPRSEQSDITMDSGGSEVDLLRTPTCKSPFRFKLSFL